MFSDIDDVKSQLATVRYIATRKLATVVFLATRLNKPVLVDGPAGVGKTELAKALAQVLDRSLIRLQCYEGLDEAKALYEWEYGKQLLYTHVLREKINQVIDPAQTLEEAAQVLRQHENVFFSEDFLVERPILRAIRSEQPAVLLIDEIDRADEEFEAFLLEFLSDYQVSIPELGTLRAKAVPLIVLTSNRTRELSEPLKRRCLHLYLDYPGADVELEIIRLKVPDIGEALARELVGLIQSIRSLDLRKAPSISETLDWAQTLVVLNAPNLSKELIEETLSVIVKHERDAEKTLVHLGLREAPSVPVPSHHLRVRRARGIFSPGGLVPRGEGEELPLDIVATDLRGLLDHLHEFGVDEELLAHLDAQAANILKGLPALIEAMRERQRKLAPKPGRMNEIQRSSLVRIMRFSGGEERELEMAIRRLTGRIHGASTRRLHQDRSGRISMAHTLRKNMVYGGIPFQPVLRRRREQRPRLIVLCDFSLSTRNLARFWLHLLYQMQSLFSKVRSFAFVADIVEVTQLFEEQPFDHAVEELFGGRLLDVDVNSDFGHAAARFRNDYAAAVTRRTTLVILGDGRNNGKDPNIKDFEEITRNARRVIWMTPEPRWGWSIGSCDMPLYETLCHRVEIVRNIEQLATVAEKLARTANQPR